MSKKKEQITKVIKVKPIQLDITHHNDSGNSPPGKWKTGAPPTYIEYKGPLRGGRHEPYPLTQDEIDGHVSLLVLIGQNENPEAFIGH